VSGRAALRLHRQRAEVIAGRLQSLSPWPFWSGVQYRPGLALGGNHPRASRVKPHDRVNVKVHRGEFMARVEKVGGEEEDPQPSLTLGPKGV